jgi:3-deoxy-7-phosphoheptulonate synthase
MVSNVIFIMKQGATEAQIEAIAAILKKYELGVHLSKGTEATIIGVIGDKSKLLAHVTPELLPGVERCVPIAQSYKLASRTLHPEGKPAVVCGVTIGGTELAKMAGPGAVARVAHVFETA